MGIGFHLDDIEESYFKNQDIHYINTSHKQADHKFTNDASEIFAEIDTLIVRRMIPDAALIDDRLITDIAELKKKYIGKDTNVTTKTEEVK